MPIDIELYRRRVRVATQPPVYLSAIDISPERPQRTLVFLHGYGGKAIQWKYQLQEFSFANRVIALDLRGHGLSDKPEGDYSMKQIQYDLETAFEALGLERFVLLGHSFGGAVAAEFAAAHPQRIEQLILVAAAGEYRLNPLYRFALQMPIPVLQAIAPAIRKWLYAPPHVMHGWYHQNLKSWNGWSLFRGLTTPTLVIRGHWDMVFSRAMFAEVARVIPGAEDVDVGASGHMVMLERREAVNRAIQRAFEEPLRSWREDRAEAEVATRETLLKERPWLAKYDAGVPFTVATPRAPLHYLLRSAAHRFPSHTAVQFEGYRMSYRKLSAEVNRFATALLGLGINRGDRVMLLLPNLPQTVISFFGALEAGAVPVFTLPSTEPEELIRQLRHSGAKVLVTLTHFDEIAQRARLGLGDEGYSLLEHIIFTHVADYLPRFKRLALSLSAEKRKAFRMDIPLEEGMARFTDLLSHASPKTPEVASEPDDLAVIIYTGGTTAVPKGVMLSHRNLTANALQTRHWMPSAKEGHERFLCVIPFSHSYGLTTGLNTAIALGATLILKARFEVADVLKTIKRHRPTIFPGVPQMYVALKDFRGVRRFGVGSIKACISGSAPLAVEVQEAFEKLTRGRLVEGYGLTEASPVTHANPLEGQRKIGSIGVPLPSTEAKVVDLLHGWEEVKLGQIGELAVRGPQVMMGYWKDRESTQRAINAEGWLLTGDVAQMDAEGYFRIVARKAELWYPDKPGNPAFPRDVEEVLYEVPQVKEATVVAIANQPIAFVIAQKERPTAEALIAYCKRRLPPELTPRLVIFVEDFPRSFIGKVLRRELARRYESQQGNG